MIILLKINRNYNNTFWCSCGELIVNGIFNDDWPRGTARPAAQKIVLRMRADETERLMIHTSVLPAVWLRRHRHSAVGTTQHNTITITIEMCVCFDECVAS